MGSAYSLPFSRRQKCSLPTLSMPQTSVNRWSRWFPYQYAPVLCSFGESSHRIFVHYPHQPASQALQAHPSAYLLFGQQMWKALSERRSLRRAKNTLSEVITAFQHPRIFLIIEGCFTLHRVGCVSLLRKLVIQFGVKRSERLYKISETCCH